MPNAANAAQVAELLRAAAPAGIAVTDRHRELAVLAVQGPRSGVTLRCWTRRAGLHGVRRRRDGTRVCRTGYTGEHGYELLVPVRTRRARCGTGWWRPGRRPGRARRPRHPAHRDGLPAARPGPQRRTSPRCRRAAAGRSAGASPSSGAATRWSPRRRPGPARRLRGLRATGRGVPRPGMDVLARRRARRRHHVGHVLADAEGRHRAGAARRGGRTWRADARGDRRRARRRACRAWSTKPPFVPSHVPVAGRPIIGAPLYRLMA